MEGIDNVIAISLGNGSENVLKFNNRRLKVRKEKEEKGANYKYVDTFLVKPES